MIGYFNFLSFHVSHSCRKGIQRRTRYFGKYQNIKSYWRQSIHFDTELIDASQRMERWQKSDNWFDSCFALYLRVDASNTCCSSLCELRFVLRSSLTLSDVIWYKMAVWLRNKTSTLKNILHWNCLSFIFMSVGSVTDVNVCFE